MQPAPILSQHPCLAWVSSLVINNMQGISDPETFELSETVEKSSKSGIFTNKRLLMIKDGFLYYFSNVPADYKAHEPNLMSSLKEFPKCSIEIRSIQSIKLESAKSSTLVITFYDKDMIDREDIRKSLSSKNYSHPVKPNRDDLEEWKFIFATVMKCRLWYGSLVKLKQHFVKSQDKFDKFAEYMANFDPQIRSSLPQLSNRASAPISISSPTNSNFSNLPAPKSPTRPSNTNSPQSKYKMEKESGIFQIQESNEEYDEEITPKSNLNKFHEKEHKNVAQKMEIKPVIIEESEKAKQQPSMPINDHEPQKDFKKQKTAHQQQKQKQKQPHKQPQQIVSQEIIVSLPASQQELSREASIAEDIRREEEMRRQHEKRREQELRRQQEQEKRRAEEEAEARRLEKEALKAKQEAELYNKQLQQQEELIRKMSEEIEANKKAKQQLEERVRQQQEKREEQERLRLMLERERREQEEYKRLRESLKSQSPLPSQRASKEIVARQQSVRTQYERELIQVIEGGRQPSKFSRYSVKSDLSLNPLTNQRDTLNLFRNTISYISEVKIESHDVENYDYFWEIGQLYRNSDVKERISRQLQLAEFVARASKKATELIVHYIDFSRPRESVTIDRNMFEIEIVCERGRLIRTEGSDRLIYPNENHQRLKRAFKIYNQLTDAILGVLKKKPSFPIRAPFACLVQYKGYTALAKIMPPLQERSLNTQALKLLGPSFPVYNLALKDFDCRGNTCSIVQPTIYFKPTKQDETSILRFPERSNDFLSNNRRANISIASKKLFEQSKQVQGHAGERLNIAQMISFCRELKKIMKANTPYTDDSNNEFQFFEDFLKHPSEFMEGAIEATSQGVNGLLLHYIQRILGIKMKSKHNTKEQPSYFATPVKRKFALSALDVSVFAGNFDRYLCEKKYQLADKSLGYFKQIEEDYSETLMREVSLHISQGRCQQALERLELCTQMMGLHDPRRLRVMELQAQCLEAVGQVSHALAALKGLLEETEYLYSSRAKSRLVDVYFLIADLLSRQSLISQLIQVYRRILHESPESRQKVLLDFARNLLREETDPHILLDFLQKELPESIQQNNSQIQRLLGQLYYRAKNRPKALGFFVAALANMASQPKQLQQIYDIFKRAMECCGSIRQKRPCHRQIVSKLSAVAFSEEQQCRKINTLICSFIAQGFSDEERDNIIIFLQYNKGTTQAKLLEWGWMQSLLRKVGRSQEISAQQRDALVGSIDTNVLSESLILLNSPNLI